MKHESVLSFGGASAIAVGLGGLVVGPLWYIWTGSMLRHMGRAGESTQY